MLITFETEAFILELAMSEEGHAVYLNGWYLGEARVDLVEGGIRLLGCPSLGDGGRLGLEREAAKRLGEAR